MTNLKTVEIKTFIPSKDYQLCKQFYTDLGFTLASDTEGVAYFYRDHCSFLLQDFYQKKLAENFMMHLLVEDIESWYQQLEKSNIADRYSVKMTEIAEQPWGMLDFVLYDPSGVVWRIAQNIQA